MAIIHKRKEPNLTTDLESRNFCFEIHALFCWKDLLSKYGEFGGFFLPKISFLPFILDFFVAIVWNFVTKLNIGWDYLLGFMFTISKFYHN
jgi:hypothetical protein